MGSATVYELARRGRRVLGLEQFDIPHDRGSSHGVTRIIRLAYYEHPSYVPLLRRAYELWRELQTKAGEQLLYITGAIDAGPPGKGLFEGSLESCKLFGLPHEVMNGDELHRRIPGYRLPKEELVLLQPDGGFLLSERCIVACTMAALEAGAEIRAREQVVDWSATSSGVRVRTTRGQYDAGSLVITAGAWASQLVPALKGVASPERQVLAWFQPKKPKLFSPERFPVFNLIVEEGRYYGFPVFGVPGFKVGRYHHLEEPADPDRLNREVSERDEAVLREFTEKYFPEAAGPTMALKVCMFTNSPDEHFIIDILPDNPQVAIAAGFSGHGFKFCSVVGEIMADLAIRGDTGHDIGMFSLGRFPPTAST
ncbi:MAG: N-methyl-L-tryptophan oxidase [Chloroflexi bacterium]|nr:N-methyl-L-tryptophan oxidase [Chloroflexota bacterium]